MQRRALSAHSFTHHHGGMVRVASLEAPRELRLSAAAGPASTTICSVSTGTMGAAQLTFVLLTLGEPFGSWELCSIHQCRSRPPCSCLQKAASRLLSSSGHRAVPAAAGPQATAVETLPRHRVQAWAPPCRLR